MCFPELETKRLKLVQVNEEHINSIFGIMSNEKVMKYYGMEVLKNTDEALQIVEFFRKSYGNKKSIRWGLIVKESGDFVGTLGLNNLSISTKKAEIGFELHPSYWNTGLMSEAVREVLRYSFEELSLYRIGAVTFLQNEASVHLLRKVGFSKEGVLRGYLYQNNAPHDAFMFSLVRTEY